MSITQIFCMSCVLCLWTAAQNTTEPSIKAVSQPCDKSVCPKCPPEPKTFNYNDVQCYKFANKNSTPIIFFEQLTNSSRQPTIDNTIFLVDTTCAGNENVFLNPSQACALESAAKLHPNRDIFMIFVAPKGLPKYESVPIIQTLLDNHPNIFLRNLHLPYFMAKNFHRRFVEKWFLSGEMFNKYGGTYLDEDVICMKSLDELKPNYVGTAERNLIQNAILNFNHNGTMHEIVSVVLNEFAEGYTGEYFSFNGPYRLSSVLKRVCGEKNSSLMTREHCGFFEVHPQRTFFEMNVDEWDKLFEPNQTALVLDRVKDSFAVHTYNSHRNWAKIKNGPDSAYSVLAKRFCPKTAEVHLEEF